MRVAGVGSLAAAALVWMLSSCSSGGDAFSSGGGAGASDAGLDAAKGGASASGGSGASAGGGGSSATGATGGTGAVDAWSGCKADSECAAPTPVCDNVSGLCVECLPANDPCPAGQFCDATNKCASGCTDNGDCSGTTALCDKPNNKCVECLTDSECGAGKICVQNACAQGCSTTQPCTNTAETCCGASCHDLQTDVNNCGTCANKCASPTNATATCSAGQCGISCAAGFLDCNKTALDGCEVNTATQSCLCVPGASSSCYTGPTGTENKGLCKAGTQTCEPSGLAQGPCFNQVVPSAEICANGIDEDCSGVADDVPDTDLDGWTSCNGDCCETAAQCSAPKAVNPGAFEFGGNGVDDDCDGTVDNVLAGCDGVLASNSSNGLDYAKAIDLCQFTTETPPLAQKKWGVISAAFYRANGAGIPATSSRSIRSGFGPNVLPKLGAKLATLSSGVAAAQASPNNTNPNFAPFQGGQNMATTSTVPGDWLAANGNNFPNAPGCPDPQGGTTAYDPIMLKLRIRVPTNAKSFSVESYFYSTEYPEWVCSPWNDFFVTLLDSSFVPAAGESPNPNDKNLAFYDPPPLGAPYYPVGVNLAFGNTGLFKACKNGPTGCGGGSVPGTTSTCVSTNELVGTGFDIANPPAQFINDPGWCGTSNLAGGGTGWLSIKGNIKPGETIEVRFVIWDTGDPWYDSLVVLDKFLWLVNASQPGTTPG